MKSKMTLGILLGGLLYGQQLLAISETETWQREYEFERGTDPLLVVENIWGDVRVTTHRGKTFKVSVRETRIAHNQKELDRSYDLLFLDIRQSEDQLKLVVDGINRCSGRWRDCRGCRLELQFDIQVPASANLDVSTINDGEVFVEGVDGRVDASNINGDVTVAGISQCGDFKTINGEIEVAFSHTPKGECQFKTINGDITTRLPANAGADLNLDLGHGDISSEFELTAIPQPVAIEKSPSRQGGTHYRISRATGLRLGPGGANFKFESLNGDIRIDQNH